MDKIKKVKEYFNVKLDIKFDKEDKEFFEYLFSGAKIGKNEKEILKIMKGLKPKIGKVIPIHHIEVEAIGMNKKEISKAILNLKKAGEIFEPSIGIKMYERI